MELTTGELWKEKQDSAENELIEKGVKVQAFFNNLYEVNPHLLDELEWEDHYLYEERGMIVPSNKDVALVMDLIDVDAVEAKTFVDPISNHFYFTRRGKETRY